MSQHRPRSALLVLLLSAGPLAAQCPFHWQPGSEAPSPTGQIRAILPSSGGDLYVGGSLLGGGSTLFQNIGRFDGSGWTPLGAGVDGAVEELIALSNGDVVACGAFALAGNAVAHNIARWDGLTWSSLGTGCDGPVWDMAVLPGGDLVAVGLFSVAGGVPAPGVAVWDGVSWSGLGAGPSLLGVTAVTVLPSGDVAVCGVAPQGSPDVQVWDGSSWSGLNGVSAGQLSSVKNVHALPGGELVIDGALLGPSSFFNLSIWDGAALQPLAPPFSTVHDLATAPNGDLLVAGQNAQASGPPVARFDGSSWTLVGNSLEPGFSLLEVSPSGQLVVAREGANPSVSSLGRIAALQAAQWVRIDTAPPVLGTALAAAPGGDVYCGGTFAAIEGVHVSNVARRAPTGWVALGQGVDGPVDCLAVASDGSVLVGGSFQAAGGVHANRVARWDGSSWSALGAGLSAVPQALGVHGSGAVLAVAGGGVYLFNGQAWTSVGNLIGTPSDVVALDNGDFLIAGSFFDWTSTPPLKGMARVSGGQLSFESVFDGAAVYAMVGDGAGGVYVARSGSSVGHYDGVGLSWVASTSSLGSVRVLQVAPNGDLVAAAGATGSNKLHRWDGASWTELVGSPAASVFDMVLGARGEIYVAGGFYTAGSVVSSGVARAETSCPASVSTFGAVCVGSAGLVELEARAMPWLGTTVEQVATGIAPGALALHLIGTHASVLPLPFGVPGCSLTVAPDVSEALLPQNGEVTALLTIPSQAALIGQDVLTQVLGLEPSAGAARLQTTGSNALQLTIGAF